MLVQIIYERAFAELEKDLASQRADVEKHNQVCHRICAWKSVFVLQEVLLGGPIPPGTHTNAHTHAYIHTYMHTYIHTNIHTNMHTYS